MGALTFGATYSRQLSSLPPNPIYKARKADEQSIQNPRSPSNAQSNFHQPVSANFPHTKIDNKMVVALGPGKFYGSSLPRPRFYTDVKFNSERVDPPVSILDPLLSWATDAHWSMGGLSYKRLRLQGRIEGNVKKLRKEREKSERKRSDSLLTPIAVLGADDEPEFEGDLSDSPPPTPIVDKKRRRLALFEEEEEEEEEEAESVNGGSRKRRLIRKLKDDFDMVADKSPLKEGLRSVASRTRSRKSEVNEEVKSSKKKKRKLKKAVIVSRSASPVSASPKGARTSPRLIHGSR